MNRIKVGLVGVSGYGAVHFRNWRALAEKGWEAHVVFTVFFNRDQARQYWSMQFRFVLLCVALCFLSWGGASLVPFPGIIGLLVKGFIAAVISAGFLIAFFRQDVMALMNALRKKS